MRRRAQRSIIRAAPALAAVLLLGALTWPLLFTYSGFANDWEHHLWLLWHQSRSIESSGFPSPSLFLNSSYSVFYPLYAFYGGTLYAVGGIMSLALGGSPVQAYIVIYLLDFIAVLGGWYWLARMAGVGRWLALVPGLIFVTSTYYLVLVYVRGDFPEFTGASMIPTMLAAALSILRARRLRVGPAAALAASSIIFFGAHNITILLGLSTLALGGLAAVALIPEARGIFTPRGVTRVAAVVVPAALVSAWYLLPTLVYESRTHIGSDYSQARESLKTTVGLVSLTHLFSFSRTGGPGLPPPYYLALSLPVLAIAWVLVGLVVLPRGSHARIWLRLALVCSAVTLLIALVMTHVGLLLALPRVYTSIQFSYRLETYVLFGISAAILAALALARHDSRRARAWVWMALPVCIVSLVGAIQQISSFPYPGQDRYSTLESYGEVETGNNRDFQDVSAPVIDGRGLPTLEIPYTAVHDDRVSFTAALAPGALAATNIGAGSYLVKLTGAKAVGVDSLTGDMVVRIGPENGAGAGRSPQARISVGAGTSTPIVLGRVLSALGLLLLALELSILATARLLRAARSGAAAS